MSEKKLKRSNDRVISGVAAGVAEYLGLDATIIRIIWAILGLSGGVGLIAYLVCMLIMPQE